MVQTRARRAETILCTGRTGNGGFYPREASRSGRGLLKLPDRILRIDPDEQTVAEIIPTGDTSTHRWRGCRRRRHDPRRTRLR